ncbi:MAG: hypothetical protein NXI07_14235 [bacterium]|nr:hypothetical protein [bacterium]
MTGFDWSFKAEQSLLRVQYHGLLRIDFVDQAKEARRGLGIEPGGVRVLVDVRDADLSEVTSDDFKNLEARRPRLDTVVERAACLVGRESDIGIAHLWALYRNRSAPNSTAAFLIERQALAWLLKDR